MVGNCRQSVFRRGLATQYTRTEIYRHRTALYEQLRLFLGESALRADYDTYRGNAFVFATVKHAAQSNGAFVFIAQEQKVDSLSLPDYALCVVNAEDRGEYTSSALLNRL